MLDHPQVRVYLWQGGPEEIFWELLSAQLSFGVHTACSRYDQCNDKYRLMIFPAFGVNCAALAEAKNSVSMSHGEAAEIVLYENGVWLTNTQATFHHDDRTSHFYVAHRHNCCAF